MEEHEPGSAGSTPFFDEQRAAAAVRELLLAVGEDPDRAGLEDTPQRVARSFRELLNGMGRSGSEVLSTTFDLAHEEMVLVRDIEVYSLCEHHMVPFHGVAHVGYIPAADGRITGLSKLARLVDIYSHRLQVQERMTSQIADDLMNALGARGAIVVVDCEHLCMAMRGVRKPGARTLTSAVRGLLKEPVTRAEAMSLILGN
jgi:GTP cyclohydrolase I